MRRKAAEEARELAAKEAAWRARMQAMNDATAAANATLQAFRAAERERERLVDAAVEGEHRERAGRDRRGRAGGSDLGPSRDRWWALGAPLAQPPRSTQY